MPWSQFWNRGSKKTKSQTIAQWSDESQNFLQMRSNMSNFKTFKPRSAFNSDSEYAIYYRDVIRPATLGNVSQAKVEYQQQRQQYFESRAPSTDHGKEKQKNETLLASYRASFRAAQRAPMGPDVKRMQFYEELIQSTEATIAANDETAKFKATKSYQQTLEQAQAIRALAPNDEASQTLVSLAFESFEKTQDAEQFRKEVEGITQRAEFAEANRRADAAIALSYERFQTALKGEQNAELTVANEAAIQAAKGVGS
jgi:hypothetical protein